MRNYNFRKQAKQKEQERRKFLWHLGYWPTMPREVRSIDSLQYKEGAQNICKQYWDREANKRVRRTPLEDIANGNFYRKIYDIMWIWF